MISLYIDAKQHVQIAAIKQALQTMIEICKRNIHDLNVYVCMI